jgi:hypothetical protein
MTDKFNPRRKGSYGIDAPLFAAFFVPIETVGDAERAEGATLIREAAALDPTDWEKPTRNPAMLRRHWQRGKRRK